MNAVHSYLNSCNPARTHMDLCIGSILFYKALTTSTVKKAGYSSGDVAAQYIYKNTSADLK
ncbi:hypothetical protein MIMGU_mgv1a0236612mg, partial [Erythranthe guttata]